MRKLVSKKTLDFFQKNGLMEVIAYLLEKNYSCTDIENFLLQTKFSYSETTIRRIVNQYNGIDNFIKKFKNENLNKEKIEEKFSISIAPKSSARKRKITEIPDEIQKTIATGLKNHNTLKEIATRIGVGKTTVHKMIRKCGGYECIIKKYFPDYIKKPTQLIKSGINITDEIEQRLSAIEFAIRTQSEQLLIIHRRLNENS